MSSFAENFLRLLSTALESVDTKQTALAASAVWALLHNCSKVIILTLYTLYSYTLLTVDPSINFVYNTLIYLLQIKHSLKKSELAEKLGNAYFSLKADQPTSTGRRVHSVCLHW